MVVFHPVCDTSVIFFCFRFSSRANFFCLASSINLDSFFLLSFMHGILFLISIPLLHILNAYIKWNYVIWLMFVSMQSWWAQHISVLISSYYFFFRHANDPRNIAIETISLIKLLLRVLQSPYPISSEHDLFPAFYTPRLISFFFSGNCNNSSIYLTRRNILIIFLLLMFISNATALT